jgi:hypothetical protein
MRSIFDEGKDIFTEIKQTGNPSLLTNLYSIRTNAWKYPIIHDECGSYGIFDDIAELDSGIAFELISIAVKLVIDQRDEILFTTALSLLFTCIEQSDTTEMPNAFAESWKQIDAKVGEIRSKGYASELWDRIKGWYRIEQ